MRRQKKKKLIGKWYLLGGVLLFVFGVCNVLFNRSVRESLSMVGIELSPEPVDIGRLLPTFSRGRAPTTSSAMEAISAEELEKFAEAFVNQKVPIYGLPPDPEPTPPGNGGRPRRDARLENSMIDTLWPVRVSGTFVDIVDDKPTALIGKDYCKVGRTILSRKPERCGYRILGIGTRCVWLLAYDNESGKGPPDIPEISSWPDVSFIVSERREGKMMPVHVRFAGGQTYSIGKRFKVSRSDEVVYKIVKLWQNGVCFQARKGDLRVYLVCMLVVNR